MRQSLRPAVQPLLHRALASANIFSAVQEREMLVRYHQHQDRAAMDELVRSRMPIIFRVAGRSTQNTDVDINDLMQTATEGLLIAINRWSLEKSDASGTHYAESLSERADGQGQGMHAGRRQQRRSGRCDGRPNNASSLVPLGDIRHPVSSQ